MNTSSLHIAKTGEILISLTIKAVRIHKNNAATRGQLYRERQAHLQVQRKYDAKSRHSRQTLNRKHSIYRYQSTRHCDNVQKVPAQLCVSMWALAFRYQLYKLYERDKNQMLAMDFRVYTASYHCFLRYTKESHHEMCVAGALLE